MFHPYVSRKKQPSCLDPNLNDAIEPDETVDDERDIVEGADEQDGVRGCRGRGG